MSKLEIQLNQNQKQAVEHTNGPLLVIAGAGTGKTRVITEKVKKLLLEKKAEPENILALTFTNKATNEMLERIEDALPLAYEDPWIHTFHSFCERILKKEGLEIGLNPDFEIISDPEKWLLVRKNLFKLNIQYYRPLGSPSKFISAILKFISRLQDEDITPQDFETFLKNMDIDKEERIRWEELSQIYLAYENLKVQNSKMDFGDLITWTLKLFRERPAILRKYQEQFTHILIDEFQDTNYAQYELIKLLFPRENTYSRELTVVGDDSQSIYKFRGAAISNIIQFMDDYPETERITLIENYRSPQSILDPAYKLITNNNPDTLECKLGISKKLISNANDQKTKPEVIELKNEVSEVDFVISKIVEILGYETQYSYKDFAILARANNHLEPFILGLRSAGLPYQLVANHGLYDRDEIRGVISLLKSIVNPREDLSLYRAMTVKTLGIEPLVLSDLASCASIEKRKLHNVALSSKDEKVREFLDLIKEFQEKSTKSSPSTLILDLLHKTNYVSMFLEEENLENQLSLKNLNIFLEKERYFEKKFHKENKEIPTLMDFLEYLENMIEAGENPAQAEIEDIDTITLGTVHSAKGLEFPVVFLVNLASSKFPSPNRKDSIEIPLELVKETLPEGNSHIQEERRIFYVGMTRAKKYLFLTYAKDYGGARKSKPSPFILETGIKINSMESDENQGIINRGLKQESLFGIHTPFRTLKSNKEINFDPSPLSYSQLETYEKCPLQYRYKYVLNVPYPPSPNLSFGNTIHETLREFHDTLRFGDVSLEKLLEIYERNWEPLGYDSEEHRQERFESGKEILKKYFENLDKSVKTLEVEKTFTLEIDEIKLKGRIDRIDELENGVEIIDYKTGQQKDQNDVNQDKQMTIYALGAREALKLNPVKLTMYFVEGGQKISTTKTENDVNKIKGEVKETISSIKAGKFDPKPGFHCRWCEYKEFCPVAQKDTH